MPTDSVFTVPDVTCKCCGATLTELLNTVGGEIHYTPFLFDKIAYANDLIAEEMFQLLQEQTIWEQKSVVIHGQTHPQPRLISWQGDNYQKYTYSGISLTAAPFTNVTHNILTFVYQALSPAQFNTCLLNFYRDGKDTIGWHADNEKVLGDAPLIATVSLGSTRTFRIKSRKGKHRFDIPVLSGSLLIMAGNTQQVWLHSIDTEPTDAPRISLTFRYTYE